MRRIVLSIVVMLAALLPIGAFAQTAVNGSSFQVQNLSETQVANIVITYYNPDGTVATTQNDQVPAGGSATYFNGQGGTKAMAAPAGFRGSVVISSDQPIAAIVNLLAAGSSGESYSGFASGGGTAQLPLIMRNNTNAFNESVSTTFSVQNTGSTSTDVTVAYTPGEAGTAATEGPFTIAPGAARIFSQAGNTSLGSRFVGSAKVTASNSGSIAVTVQQESATQLLSYSGFAAGGATIAAPLVMANNFGNFTSLNIQNSGATDASVTVTYTPNGVTTGETASQAVCATPPAATFPLAAGASKVLIQAGFGPASAGFDPFFASCRYVGGATITATGGTVVAVVNQVSQRNKNASSYEGFNVASATNTSKAPLVFANNYGLISSVQVQNVGSSSTTITLTYAPNTVGQDPGAAAPCGTPTAKTNITLAAGASVTFLQSGAGPASDGFDSQFATCRYVGSATVTAASPSDKIVAIVNQVNLSAGNDTLFTYNGFNTGGA